jgi:hypothetical protein
VLDCLQKGRILKKYQQERRTWLVFFISGLKVYGSNLPVFLSAKELRKLTKKSHEGADSGQKHG